MTGSTQWNDTSLENMEGSLCVIDLEPCLVNCVLLGKQLCSLSAFGLQGFAKNQLVAGKRKHRVTAKQRSPTWATSVTVASLRRLCGSRFFWLILPRMDGAGDGVVAVVHGVWSPAVAPHALRAVVSGHSQVLREGSRKTDVRKKNSESRVDGGEKW